MAAAVNSVNVNFPNKAPIQLSGEFVSAVMRKDFHNALVLCQALLLLEPNNETYIEFEKTLREAKEHNLKLVEDICSESDYTSDDEDDKNIDTDNDTTTDEDDDDDDDDDEDSGNNESSDFSDTDTSSEDGDDDEDGKDDIDLNSDSDMEDYVSPGDLNGLNLLVGGLSVSRSG